MKTLQLKWSDILTPDVELDKNIIVESKVSQEEWDNYLDLFGQAKIFGLDLETHGEEEYSALYFRFGLIRLISVSIQVGDDYYALIYDLGGNLDDIEEKREAFIHSRFFQILKSKCEDVEVPIVGQNLKFDGTFLLYHFGILLLNCRDLMLCSQVIWAGIEVIPGNISKNRADRCLLSHSLKAITERINILYSTNFEVDKTEQKEDWGWRISNSKLNYSGNDSILPLRLFPYIQDLVVKNDLYYSVMAECLVLSAFIEMEVYGFPIDIELLEENIEKYKSKLDEYNQILIASFPDISWGQVEQMRLAFNEKWSELELSSLDVEALKRVEYPEAKALLKMRTLNVLIQYAQGIRDVAWKNKGENFYSVRTNYRQMTASGSGRSSCTGDLNYKDSKGTKKKISIGTQLQNPAKTPSWFKEEGLPEFRTFFKAPDDSFLGIIDLSASHYRICTELTQDPVLLEIYKNGKDAHLIMGHTIAKLNGFNVEYDEFVRLYKQEQKDKLVDQYRSWGKTANYSGLNQAGAKRIQASFKKNGIDVSIDQCKLIQKAYRETYSVLYAFIQAYVKQSNSYNIEFPFYNINGNPTTGTYGRCKTFTGRVVHLKKQEKISDWGIKWEIPYTDSISLIWLCGEADILKFAQGKIQIEFFKHPEWKARFCNNCHDELNWMGLKNYSYEINNCVMSILHEELRYWIKSIPVDTEFDPNKLTHQSWNDKK
jgi:DNA polymerase I-like protein with 3'-5' exonuclease and polymerase domains